MHVRAATPLDREAILHLVPRLAEHGTPPGRDGAQIASVDLETIAHAFDAAAVDTAFLVAEERGVVMGFVHVRTVHDYYTQRPIGHVSDLVVAEQAQGRGAGRALLEAAQAWAVEQGYLMMQLYVLPENEAARRLYEGIGYRAEWIKYVKCLGEPR